MPKLLNPTLAQLKTMLWKVFSEYIRRKAADYRGFARCVSCGAIKRWQELQAGHYIPRPECPLSLYFSIKNVHPQCAQCNKWKSGNLAHYAIFLIRTYGKDILEVLEEMRTQLKNEQWTKEDYKSKIEMYKKKLKELCQKQNQTQNQQSQTPF